MDYEDWPDELQEIWDNSTGYGHYLSRDEMLEFREDGADLFYEGWFDESLDEDSRDDARRAFFSLMVEFDLDAGLFDWDSWRDWYEDAS